jgi:hypothetical protein
MGKVIGTGRKRDTDLATSENQQQMIGEIDMMSSAETCSLIRKVLRRPSSWSKLVAFLRFETEAHGQDDKAEIGAFYGDIEVRNLFHLQSDSQFGLYRGGDSH